MKALIIEDEEPAAEKLKKSIQKADTSIQIAAVIGSVREAVHYLKNNPAPELIFMDIELSDGLSFKIFEEIISNFHTRSRNFYRVNWATLVDIDGRTIGDFENIVYDFIK